MSRDMFVAGPCTTEDCAHKHVLLNAVHSFVDMAQYLLSLPDVQYIAMSGSCRGLLWQTESCV